MMIKKDKDIKKSALDFGGDVRSLILTLVNAAINEEVNRWNKDRHVFRTPIDQFALIQSMMKQVTAYIDAPEECVETQVCSNCGRPMAKGFVINDGEEYYCSEECLHKRYSKLEYLALYAGLDHTDENVLKGVEQLTDEELDVLSEKNDSGTFMTEWEVII
jgi:hypothetical protein